MLSTCSRLFAEPAGVARAGRDVAACVAGEEEWVEGGGASRAHGGTWWASTVEAGKGRGSTSAALSCFLIFRALGGAGGKKRVKGCPAHRTADERRGPARTGPGYATRCDYSGMQGRRRRAGWAARIKLWDGTPVRGALCSWSGACVALRHVTCRAGVCRRQGVWVNQLQRAPTIAQRSWLSPFASARRSPRIGRRARPSYTELYRLPPRVNKGKCNDTPLPSRSPDQSRPDPRDRSRDQTRNDRCIKRNDRCIKHYIVRQSNHNYVVK